MYDSSKGLVRRICGWEFAAGRLGVMDLESDKRIGGEMPLGN